jgi:hypothetical protein
VALTKIVNLYIPQGSTYTHKFNYKKSDDTAVDLTGFSARMQIKEFIDDTSAQWEGTTASGDLTIDTSNGSVTVKIPATDTSSFDFTRGVYDIELEDGSGEVTRLVKGEVYVDKEVTT